MFQKFIKHEKGITGLETAIILIAFVVVAAVFAYTVLSAGLFSTQKGQEAVYSGLKEAQSTLELKGSVIATANTTGTDGTVGGISFVVSNVLGGEPVDFTTPASDNVGVASTDSHNKIVINYIDKDQTVKNLYWTVAKMGDDNGNNLLEANEKFEVTVSDLSAALGADTQLSVNKTFDLEVVTPAGAVLTVERTTPAYIDQIMNLH
jgi:flagellin FlaB